jgi:hypothetical protein
MMQPRPSALVLTDTKHNAIADISEAAAALPTELPSSRTLPPGVKPARVPPVSARTIRSLLQLNFFRVSWLGLRTAARLYLRFERRSVRLCGPPYRCAARCRWIWCGWRRWHDLADSHRRRSGVGTHCHHASRHHAPDRLHLGRRRILCQEHTHEKSDWLFPAQPCNRRQYVPSFLMHLHLIAHSCFGVKQTCPLVLWPAVQIMVWALTPSSAPTVMCWMQRAAKLAF